jgi:dolichyl-phosphate-mannose-protein mannosyltransferase
MVALVLLTHLLMLTWGALRHSPTINEPGHLAAGLSHWYFGRFELYRVNPPLVRTLAAIPVTFGNPGIDWSKFHDHPGSRAEFSLGLSLAEANGARLCWLVTLARWACIPFSLLGAWVCYCWATRLYGDTSGLCALALWCFSPNVLAHGQLITPDMGATSLGLFANYVFWLWLRQPGWSRSILVGIVLGLALLTKLTWIILLPLWPIIWIVWFWGEQRENPGQRSARQLPQLAAILVVGLYVLNLGYLFEGTFTPLRDFQFVSHALAGTGHSDSPTLQGSNRFRRSALGNLPVSLPGNYLLGIDTQKRDFEVGRPSFMRGKWQSRGAPHFYLYALAVKVPLGTMGLAALAVLASCLAGGYSATWRDELVLLAPPLTVWLLVSSQTGFTEHFRYVMPSLPFFYVWISKVGRSLPLKHRAIAVAAISMLCWSIGSSLAVYPHSLSYFNELAGGPLRGHAHLQGSNTDWGQDLLYLRRWLSNHPSAQPLKCSLERGATVQPRIAGIDAIAAPKGPDRVLDSTSRPERMGPRPGWYAISVNRLRDRSREYAYFLRFQPVATAGYSVYIYHITLEEANRVRRDLGLSELPGGWDRRQEPAPP